MVRLVGGMPYLKTFQGKSIFPVIFTRHNEQLCYCFVITLRLTELCLQADLISEKISCLLVIQNKDNQLVIINFNYGH